MPLTSKSTKLSAAYRVIDIMTRDVFKKKEMSDSLDDFEQSSNLKGFPPFVRCIDDLNNSIIKSHLGLSYDENYKI